MAFRVNNLMINVLPSGQIEERTDNVGTPCAGTRLAGPGGNAASKAALATLKRQLKQQLAAVEKQQTASPDSLLPQSVGEVDDLTTKLNGALKELKIRRSELSKKPAPVAKKTAAKTP